MAATTAEQVKLDSGDGGRLPATWLEEEAADFAGFVERRCAVRELWGVSVTELWFGDGTDYLGAVIIRHASTPDLEREGGPGRLPRRPRPTTTQPRQPNARPGQTGVPAARLTEILVTCAEGNLGSRR